MTKKSPHEIPEQFLLRKYALIGARRALEEIEQERQKLLELFPELADPRFGQLTATPALEAETPSQPAKLPKTNGHAKATPKQRAWMTTGIPTLRPFYDTGPSSAKDLARASKITTANAMWRIRVQVAAGHLRKIEKGMWELTDKGRAAYQARESDIIESAIQ